MRRVKPYHIIVHRHLWTNLLLLSLLNLNQQTYVPSPITPVPPAMVKVTSATRYLIKKAKEREQTLLNESRKRLTRQQKVYSIDLINYLSLIGTQTSPFAPGIHIYLHSSHQTQNHLLYFLADICQVWQRQQSSDVPSSDGCSIPTPRTFIRPLAHPYSCIVIPVWNADLFQHPCSRPWSCHHSHHLHIHWQLVYWSYHIKPKIASVEYMH